MLRLRSLWILQTVPWSLYARVCLAHVCVGCASVCAYSCHGLYLWSPVSTIASLENLVSILRPTPDPLNKKLWGWGPGVWVLISSSGDSGANYASFAKPQATIASEKKSTATAGQPQPETLMSGQSSPTSPLRDED